MHVRCNNQYKTGADRGKILGQPMLFECIDICVLSPAHGSVVKIISSILFKFSHSILDWTVLSWNFWEFLKTFLEGSVYHIIYRDYIVNRRFFIDCSLACSRSLPSSLPLSCRCRSADMDW